MDSEVMQVMDTQAYSNAAPAKKGPRWAPFLLLGLVVCGVALQAATLSMVADLNSDVDDLEDQTPPPAAAGAGRVMLQRCPTVDPLTDGAPIAVPPDFDREFVGTYPVIPNIFSLAGFRFTALDRGQMDATMKFDIPNATRTVSPTTPPLEDWCSEVGAQSFRIQFYGLCLHYTDAYYSYVKVVAESQLSTDCFGKPKPGGCRLVRVSRDTFHDVAQHGTWTEFELPPAALGGGIEWEHTGSKMGMRIKYSLCPDRIDDTNSSRKVQANF
eukprot:Hpha_TRINITY_DN13100_c0_g2::TRINITY_DN13100_c0_g2_i1::g.113610::m.113610